MTARVHGAQVYIGVKAALRRAVSAYGGSEALSHETRIARQNIDRAGSISPDVPVAYPPADLIVDVDFRNVQSGGRPHIIEYMAQICGFALVRLDAQQDKQRATSKALKEAGEAVSTIGEALADGEISPDEAVAVRKEVVEAMDAFNALIPVLDKEVSNAG